MFVKEITVMNFENCFPLWNDLNTAQKKIISDNLITQYVKKGTIIHNGKQFSKFITVISFTNIVYLLFLDASII